MLKMGGLTVLPAEFRRKYRILDERISWPMRESRIISCLGSSWEDLHRTSRGHANLS